MEHATHAPARGHESPPHERHRPEESLLYKTLQRHWRTFQAEAEGEHENGLPRFIVAEFEAYLRCGILAHGFLRARCQDCGGSRLVAFSCKRRGFCGSCIGRRMCDTAAHLVDNVLPRCLTACGTRWRTTPRWPAPCSAPSWALSPGPCAAAPASWASAAC